MYSTFRLPFSKFIFLCQFYKRLLHFIIAYNWEDHELARFGVVDFAFKVNNRYQLNTGVEWGIDVINILPTPKFQPLCLI